MNESGFPKSVHDIVATLAEIFREKGGAELIELLESAVGQIVEVDRDNWNGGTYTYELRLEIPVPIFARIQHKLKNVENTLSESLGIICRNYSNQHLESVVITPLSVAAKSMGRSVKPAEADVRHIWRSGFFRLFLSHVSEHKVAVGALKRELSLRGISAFVAHEDIEPDKEWEREIELALQSMHALAALVTTSFHQSDWTEQEIGFALGPGVAVFPVRIGADPRGFIKRLQAPASTLLNPQGLAKQLVTRLLADKSTRQEMRRSVIVAWTAANSSQGVIALAEMICEIADFSNEHKFAIQQACIENQSISAQSQIVDQVLAAIDMPLPVAKHDNDIPF